MSLSKFSSRGAASPTERSLYFGVGLVADPSNGGGGASYDGAAASELRCDGEAMTLNCDGAAAQVLEEADKRMMLKIVWDPTFRDRRSMCCGVCRR